MDIDDVTIETFAGREGETFAIEFADGTLELALASVDGLPEEWGRMDKRAPFSVQFHGPIERILPQRMWPLDHEELGRLEIFLVPLGPDEEQTQQRYEAVFT